MLQKQGENFSDVFMQKVGKARDFIRNHSPDTAAALTAGNPEVLSLKPEILAQRKKFNAQTSVVKLGECTLLLKNCEKL